MNDHGLVDKQNISMIIHYHTVYLVQLWLRQTEHIHDHSLLHRIFGSTMTTTNETYPWSFITTQNTWFNYYYDKRNISMIIHYHTVNVVQPWLRQTKHIHDHSLPHSKLGSTMTTTKLNQVFCVVMNDHGYVSFVVVMVEPNILCGNEWSWICSVCRSHSWTKYTVW
jgi:hypothetical protein